MRPALLIVDLQRDYLARPALMPDADTLLAATAALLRGFRDLGLPVLHARTLVDDDGVNRMAHWVRDDIRLCVRGTPGAAAPDVVAELAGEPVFAKPYYSAFAAPELRLALAREGVDTLVIAGLYTHACVRATALDAYQSGLKVVIAGDAVASCEQDHARITLDYLAARMMPARPVQDILAGLRHPAVRVGRGDGAPLLLRDPCDWDRVLDTVAVRGPRHVEAEVGRLSAAQPRWADIDEAPRHARVADWANRIAASRGEFVACLVRDIAKPQREAEAEFDYGLALLRQAIGQGRAEASDRRDLLTRHRPQGVVAAITPWNNPFALALGKLAPALTAGNAVAWKPAPAGDGVARLIGRTLRESGLDEWVAVIGGDAATAAMLAAHPGVAAISFTGSSVAGHALETLCAAARKPLQAELGGNNPAIVLAGAKIQAAAADIAGAAFSFSGQRCTAPRRIIVEAAQLDAFVAALREAVAALPVGRPANPSTVIGPLITREKRDRLQADIAAAVAAGARLICGGHVPQGLEAGCWLAPTVVGDLRDDAVLWLEEGFGPVVAVRPAADAAAAFALANQGRHGLVASLHGGDAAQRGRFLDTVQAGMLSLDRARPAFDPSAPFGGWRDSGNGRPEHGRWDRDFFTRPQAVYSLPPVQP